MKEMNRSREAVARFRLIRNCMFLSGLSVFAQLYLFQPMLSEMCRNFGVSPAESSLSVSASTAGMALGLIIMAFKADSVSRERLMGASLLLSSLLTIVSAFTDSYSLLLALNLLKGMVLAGVSSVALAYLSEEVDKAMIGLAISLYLSGNTLGGMSGRVAATLMSGWGGWQSAVWLIGIVSLLLGGLFCRKIPAGKNFSAVSVPFREKLRQMRFLLTRSTFLSMYLIAALSMGIFVSIYNYLSFLLEAPPFSLPHHWVALIFTMYVAGIIGSVVAGGLSDKYSPEMLLQGTLGLMGVGMALLLWMQLWAIVLGLGLMTFAFFGTHTLASRIVSVHAGQMKSSATSIYWLFYYAGSSLVGSFSGIVLSHYGWGSFMEFLFVLLAVAWIISLSVLWLFKGKKKVYVWIARK